MVPSLPAPEDSRIKTVQPAVIERFLFTTAVVRDDQLFKEAVIDIIGQIALIPPIAAPARLEQQTTALSGNRQLRDGIFPVDHHRQGTAL